MSIEENAKNISMAQVACFVGVEFTIESLKQVSFYSAMSGIMKGLNMRSDRIEQLETENKKLREALEQIKNLKLPEGFYDARCEIAREALKEVKE